MMAAETPHKMALVSQFRGASVIGNLKIRGFSGGILQARTRTDSAEEPIDG